MHLLDSIAKTIKRIRKTRGLSQEQLAELSGLDRTYISGVERGLRNITIASLERIITALQLTPNEFFAIATRETDHDFPTK